MRGLTSVTIVVGMVLVAGPVEAKRENACRLTSVAARTACHAEAKDDLWIAIGNCINLADKDARGTCTADAREDLGDARDECQEQFDARQDLCEQLGQDPYDPVIDPARFLSPAATAANPNPFFPLVPGTVNVFEGGGETVTVTVTSDTKVILGVTAIVVRDTVEEGTGIVEDTDDWFAQDVDGNVWYLGELSRDYEDGELVDLGGSWTAGVDGAKPGIIMKAAPTVGDVYRQEFALGEAEDAGEVISTTGTETVPGAACAGTCVVTKDFTPLEPGGLEHKYYAPGIGTILEVHPNSGERLELVSHTTP